MNHEMKAWPDERLDRELEIAFCCQDPMPEAVQWFKDLEAEKARRVAQTLRKIVGAAALLASDELPELKTGRRAADKAKARRKSVMGSAWPRAASGRFVTRTCSQCVVRNGKHEAGCPIEYQRRNLR